LIIGLICETVNILTDELRFQLLDILGRTNPRSCHITDARLRLESVSVYRRTSAYDRSFWTGICCIMFRLYVLVCCSYVCAYVLQGLWNTLSVTCSAILQTGAGCNLYSLWPICR